MWIITLHCVLFYLEYVTFSFWGLPVEVKTKYTCVFINIERYTLCIYLIYINNVCRYISMHIGIHSIQIAHGKRVVSSMRVLKILFTPKVLSAPKEILKNLVAYYLILKIF